MSPLSSVSTWPGPLRRLRPAMMHRQQRGSRLPARDRSAPTVRIYDKETLAPIRNDPPQRALIQTRRPKKGGRTQAGCGGGAEACHGSRPGASREDIRAPGRCTREEDGCEEEWRLCQLSPQSGFRGEGARTTASEVVVAEQSSESTPIMICWPAWPAEDPETSDRYIAVPRRLGIPRQGFSEEGSVRSLQAIAAIGQHAPEVVGLREQCDRRGPTCVVRRERH